MPPMITPNTINKNKNVSISLRFYLAKIRFFSFITYYTQNCFKRKEGLIRIQTAAEKPDPLFAEMGKPSAPRS